MKSHCVNIERLLLRLTFVMLGLILRPSYSYGQDYASDIKKINQMYYGLKKFSVNLETQIFLSKKSKTPDQKVLSKVMKLADGYKTITDIMETVYTSKFVITVSKGGKSIMYAPKDSTNFNPTSVFPLVDSMMNKFDSVVYVGENEGEKHYHLFLKKNPIKEIEVYFRSADFMFTKIAYIYRSESEGIYKVVTLFKDINTNANLNQGEFNVEYYLADTDPKKIGPSIKYKGYKVIYNDFSLRHK